MGRFEGCASLGFVPGLLAVAALAVPLGCSGGASDDAGMGGAGGDRGGAAGQPTGGVGGQSGLGGQAGAAGAGGGGGTADGGRGGDSGGSGGAASGGSAGGPPAFVTPQTDGNDRLYRFDAGPLVLQVDRSAGGRIRGLSLDGYNILTGPEVDAINWGSVFWPSPQSRWGQSWPPPAAIDASAYQVEDSTAQLVLTSGVAEDPDLQVTKTVQMESNGRITLRYQMKNVGAQSFKVAPWEVTRVLAGGLTFFGTGSGGVFTEGSLKAVPSQNKAGNTWIDYTLPADQDARKTFADGKGYLAHVIPDRRLLFLKTFTDIDHDTRAPGEAEIEIYVDGKRRYAELEQQGTYESLAPGQSRDWTVTWWLRELPDDVVIEPGSASLLAAVKALKP